MNDFDIENLRRWFLAEQRDLPWRQKMTPYAVWVSEVMLQQTQAAVVIPYFERWMRQFPTVRHLAEASLDEVIKAWEGLGYYSRARNLHAGAVQVMAEYGGELPHDVDKLNAIKGLGPYTVGAIRAFAFKQKAAAVDGNVVRVLCRYDLIEEDIAKSATVRRIRQRAEQLLPDKEPWVISEALIELGATLCGRRPRCGECPLKGSCRAFAHGKADRLPVKTKRVPTTVLYRGVAVIMAARHVLVRRGEEGQIMRDLYEFPYIETAAGGMTPAAFARHVKGVLGLRVAAQVALPPVKHGFTRYEAHLSPVLFRCASRPAVPGYCWVPVAELENLPFSSGHRRIFHAAKELIGASPDADQLGNDDGDE